jgi:hypothetical protein
VKQTSDIARATTLVSHSQSRLDYRVIRKRAQEPNGIEQV